MKPGSDPPDVELESFYARVDESAEDLASRHSERLQCRRGCHHCCVDDVRVFQIEADAIRRDVGDKLRGLAAAPPGGCAFLDAEGGCRIYSSRPYVCRTQGLPLRWLDHDEASERRDICPLNDRGADLLTLSPEDFWEIGPCEAELGYLESRRVGGDALERISLRDLFAELSRRDP